MRWALSTCALSLTLAFPNDGRAQVSTDALYEDARDVVHGVIQREAVRSIVRQLTCHAQKALLVHYPSSLDHLFFERFESLAESFRTESSKVLGGYAFSRVAYDSPPPLRALYPFSWNPGCVDTLVREDLSPSQYLERVQPLIPGYLEAYEDCEVSARPLSPRRALACELGLTVEAAVADRREEALRRLVGLSSLSLAGYVVGSDAAIGAPRSWVEAHRHELDRFFREALLAFLDGTAEDLAPLLLDGSATDPTSALAARPSGMGPGEWVRSVLRQPTWSRHNRTLLAAAAVLMSERELRAELHVESALGALKTTPVPFERVLEALSLAAGPTEFLGDLLGDGSFRLAQFALRDDGTLHLEARPPAATTHPAPLGLADYKTFRDVARLVERLRTTFPPPGEGSTLSAHAWPRFLRALRAAGDLGKVWREAARRKFTATSTLQALERSVTTTDELLGCSAPAPGGRAHASCELARLASRDEVIRVLTRVLRASDQGSGVSAAFASIDDLFEVAKREPSLAAHAAELGRLQAIANTLVAQVTQASSQERGRAAAREAFRAAAYDYLLAPGNGDGYLAGWFDPLTVSTGFSWSEGYATGGGGNSRVLVSAEFLQLRVPLVKSRNAYLGLGLTLANLLGPFSEFALRDPEPDYENSGLVWANFIEPKLDATVGVPSFSRRLLLYAGVSLRPVVAFPSTAAGTQHYRDVLTPPNVSDTSLPEDEFERWLHHAVLSLGLRFVPH
jgi:hypothetical protein